MFHNFIKMHATVITNISSAFSIKSSFFFRFVVFHTKISHSHYLYEFLMANIQDIGISNVSMDPESKMASGRLL